MNLPSSLALPQSKLLRSPVGILILVVAAALIGAVAFFALRAPAPAKLPTPATSPAAQALPKAAAPTAAPVVYGPPAPDWVKRDPSVVVAAKSAVVAGAAGAAGAAAKPGAVTGPAATAAGTPGATAPAGVAAQATPVPGAATSGAAASTAAPTAAGAATATAVSAEDPKLLDPAMLFQREQYVYQAAGRRDPFQSLIDGKYQSQSGDGSLVDVGDMHLVGIMWGSSDKFALVEDSRGRGYVLRVGDPVLNGYISGISKTELQVVQNAFGDSQTVTIQLKSKEGDPNATRNQ
ncbi:MAG TPA: hypothetical protein VFT32_02550 [Candidatus Eisenbacteria bacterium]|nr:hypothetical protein [Candidatus Eisenbacteria bacterium]